MTNVTLSSKYQIVIPKEIRDLLKLKAGSKIALIPTGEGSVKLIRVPELEELRGIIPKDAPPFQREKKDREF